MTFFQKIIRIKIVQYILWILLVVYLIARALKGGDFDVYLFEADKLFHGENIYKAPFFKNMPYTYSVFWALVLIPFTFIPKVIPEFIWLVLNVFFLYRICTLLIAWLDIKEEPGAQNKVYFIFFLGFGLTVRFLLYNFSMIQMTLFLMYACMEGIELIHKKRFFLGTLLIAAAINIKIVPLVVLPYLIYRKEFKASFYIICLLVFLLFLPAIFLGAEFNNIMLHDWWQAVNPMSQGRMLGETMSGTVGLNSLIPVLLMDTAGELSYKRNFIVLPENTVKIILNLSRCFFIFLTLTIVKFPPFKKTRDSRHQVWELSYLFCIIPLLAPQQQKYAFFFVFPAIIYILFFLYSLKISDVFVQRKNRFIIIVVLMALFFVLTTLTSDGIVGRHLNLVFQHFRTITYAGIILAITLTLCNPAFLTKEDLAKTI